MEILLPIMSIGVSSIITWIVTRNYYGKSKNDFATLLSKLDVIQKTAKTYVHPNELKDPEKLDMDEIEKAIIRYARSHNAYVDGMPIHEITNLIHRVDKIKQSLQQYRDWRIHIGD
jgi:hypothetical protein